MNITKKLVIGLAVFAMVFGLAVTVKADAVSDLIAKINETQAEMQAALTALQGGATAPVAGTYTRVLPQDSTGADVIALQKFLIADGEVIPAGATGFFGPQTQAALAVYQAKKFI